MAAIDDIRTQGNRSDLYLIVDAPATVYTARASGPVAQADFSLAFNTGSGTLGDCLADMTLLIGSTAGGAERGVARLRKAPAAGVFYLGADPSLIVQANDYLTVVDEFAPFARHPVQARMDVDIAYSDQFSDWAPVPVLGGRVRVIRAGETVAFDAGLSWVPGSTITGYAWTFTGATSTTGTATATPAATYNTSGRYRISLTVTAANGKTATGYGWVYVRGANLAEIGDFQIDNIDVTADGGGRCRVVMLDRPTVRDGARAIIVADDYYSGVRQSFGPAAGMENILLAGWIVDESILRSPSDDRVEFEIAGPVEALSGIAAMQCGLFDPALPSDDGAALPAWSKCAGLTVTRGLHYLITQRSTISRWADVSVEDRGWACPKLNGTSESLWGQLAEFAGRAALVPRADRCGRIWIERDAQLVPLADRAAIPVRCTLVDADWQGELSIVRRQRGEIATAEAEGEIFSGRRLTKVGGRSPGKKPGREGGRAELNELYLPSQAAALELAGLLAGAENAEISAVMATLVHNNRLMDVAPRQYVQATVDGQTLRCLPGRMTFRRSEGGRLHTELELIPEGEAWPAVVIEYPGEGQPPAEPPTEPPTEPPPTEPPAPEEEAGEGDAVVAKDGDVRTSQDFDEENPTWYMESEPDIVIIDSDLSGTTYYLLGETELHKATDIGALGAGTVWSQMLDATDYAGELPDLRFNRVICRGTMIYVLAMTVDAGAGTIDAYLFRSGDAGATWSYSLIEADVEAEIKPYTVDTVTVGRSADVYDYRDHVGASFSMTAQHRRFDGAEAKNPYAVVSEFNGDHAIDVPRVFCAFGCQHAWNVSDAQDIVSNLSIPPGPLANWEEGMHAAINNLLSSTEKDEALSYIIDRFGPWAGSGGIWNYYPAGVDLEMPLDAARTLRRFLCDAHIMYIGDGEITASWSVTSHVIWKYPSIENMPIAIDAALTNTSWIYVGLAEKIVASYDGGYTWETIIDDRGANDICVDPQLAGVFYAWDTDGNLILVVNKAITSPALDTETPQRVPLRLARDLNSGRLWAINSGVTLKCRNLGSWTNQKEDMQGGRGLHAYLGGKLICVDRYNIWASDNYGVTVTEKRGDTGLGGSGWMTYMNGINGHRLPEVVE